jgi:hypothetical protein
MKIFITATLFYSLLNAFVVYPTILMIQNIFILEYLLILDYFEVGKYLEEA